MIILLTILFSIILILFSIMIILMLCYMIKTILADFGFIKM
jgi:hypothetical protein